MLAQKTEPTVGELLGSLGHTTASLVKQEVQLASTEFVKKASIAARAAGMMGVGGAFLQLGGLVLAFALVVGVGTLIPVWLSGAVLGSIATLIGGILFAKGLGAIRRLDAVPRQTLRTLKDDAAWAKEQVR